MFHHLFTTHGHSNANQKFILLQECDKESLLKTCTSDFCYCSDKAHPTKCACDGISVLAKDCQFRGVMLDHGWRDMEICRKIKT